jgi:hypothetical protein
MEFIQRHRFLLEAIGIVIIAAVIGVVIFFYDRIPGLGPTETSTPVVINEVYPAFCRPEPQDKKVCQSDDLALRPHQWFELYNRRGEWEILENWSVEMTPGQPVSLPRIVLPPWGYAVVAGSEQQFLADHPDYPGVLVAAAIWPGLGRQDGFLALYNAAGDPVDWLNWGSPSGTPDKVKQLWNKPAIAPGAPWILNADTGAVIADHSLERRPVGMDRDIPADFIRQPFPSPGTVYEPNATPFAQGLFIDWTNVASLAGGILLWVAFIYVALIARRFEALTQQRTFWQAMLVAPSGILFYIVVQSYGFRLRGSMTVPEQWWGFVVLFVSALLCTALVFLFRQRAKRILEG